LCATGTAYTRRDEDALSVCVRADAEAYTHTPHANLIRSRLTPRLSDSHVRPIASTPSTSLTASSSFGSPSVLICYQNAVMPNIFSALQKLGRRPKPTHGKDGNLMKSHRGDEPSLDNHFSSPGLANAAAPESRIDFFFLPLTTAVTQTETQCHLLIDNAELDQAYQTFIVAYPQYLATAHLDHIRRICYSRLDEGGHVYLDHTGKL
jgi:hypothetical protein